MEDINQIISAYPDEYVAIKKQARKYLQNGASIDEHGRINILHRPWVAPFNWGLMLYKGADKNWIDDAEETIGKSIPPFYKKFLMEINGCFLYDISMYGLVPSMTRSFLQCHSLVAANNDWAREFEIDPSFFHFGGGTYSNSENTGYFYGQNKIISIRQNGKVINHWNGFSDFLHDELTRSEEEMLEMIPETINIIVT